MIELKNISKCYGDRKILEIDRLVLNKGETLVIVGPNGSGKSTLLKLLSGVITNDGSELGFDADILYLPQKNLPFSRSVRNNVKFCCKADRSRKNEICDRMLKRLCLSELSNKNARGLSGGESQRLALARVLVNKCDFLLLDEPSSAADIEGNEIIEKAIFDYKAENDCGIIMTTHSPSQAKRLADRIIMLHNGKIVEEGTADELLRNPSTEWGKRFMEFWKIEG